MTINNTTYVMVEDGGSQTLASAAGTASSSATSASTSGTRGSKGSGTQGASAPSEMGGAPGMGGAPEMGGVMPDMSERASRGGQSRQETVGAEPEQTAAQEPVA